MRPIYDCIAVLCLALMVVLLPCTNVVGFIAPCHTAFVSRRTITRSALILVPMAVSKGKTEKTSTLQEELGTTRRSSVQPTIVDMTSSQDTSSETWQGKTLDSPIILYDGICNFCNAWVDILLRVDVNKKFKFAPLQSDMGRKLLVAIGKDANDISSVLLIEPNLEYYEKSACPLKVVEELGPLAEVVSKTAMAIVPRELRDSIYDTVAENRYKFMGKRDECRCNDPRFSDRFVS